MTEPFLGFFGSSTTTQLLLFQNNSYEILGMDIDMPLGQAYSDLSKELNIPIVDIENANNNEIINYPVPLLTHKGLDFSFAGAFYSSLQRIYPKRRTLSHRCPLAEPCYMFEDSQGMSILAQSFQHAVLLQITQRVSKAIKWVKINHPSIKVLVSFI